MHYTHSKLSDVISVQDGLLILTQIRKWQSPVGKVSNIQIFTRKATVSDSVHIYFSCVSNISDLPISPGFRINPETVWSLLYCRKAVKVKLYSINSDEIENSEVQSIVLELILLL